METFDQLCSLTCLERCWHLWHETSSLVSNFAKTLLLPLLEASCLFIFFLKLRSIFEAATWRFLRSGLFADWFSQANSYFQFWYHSTFLLTNALMMPIWYGSRSWFKLLTNSVSLAVPSFQSWLPHSSPRPLQFFFANSLSHWII